MTGTYHVFRLGHDERTVLTLGPLTLEQGVHNGTRWQQNRNGLTFTFTGFHEYRDQVSGHVWANATATRDVRLIGESVALDAYVVEINPPAGRHEWLFIAKDTGYIVRHDSIEKHRRFVTTFDDYRIFDGIAEPSRVRTVDSYGNEREQTLLSRTLDLTPDPKDVEITPSRRVLVDFPAQVPLVRLPVRFVNGLLVMRMQVGPRYYDFLLDSGAAGIVVDPSVVDDAKLERYGTRIGATLGTFSESTCIIPYMQVGGLRMRSVVSRVLSIPFRADDHTHIAGLIGFDFFADAVVHVDFEHGVVEAIAPASFHPPADAQLVPLALDDKTPVVRARAGGAPGRFVLDTGANRSVFTAAFAQRPDFGGDPVGASARFRAIGGTGNAEAVHIKQFEIGGFGLADPIVDISSADLGAEDIDGTAGSDVLHAFDLYFDYRAAAVYVRRTHKAAARAY